PFHYFGVADNIDYSNIPWRNSQFDPTELTAAIATKLAQQTRWSNTANGAGAAASHSVVRSGMQILWPGSLFARAYRLQPSMPGKTALPAQRRWNDCAMANCRLSLRSTCSTKVSTSHHSTQF